MEVSEDLLGILRCPVCRGSLANVEGGLVCQGSCHASFPLVDGIPVLINERNSVFSAQDFVARREIYFREESTLRRLAKRILPSFEVDIRSSRNLSVFLDLVRRSRSHPRVLVIGSGLHGIGMKVLEEAHDVSLIETDVSLTPRIQLVCDAHDLPFATESFDGVVIQAVLEHVLDPWRVVGEIERVLPTGGLVYAETPFMQQVHGGRFDFTRFTYLGHRRLFRQFEQVDGGLVAGPALALAWAYRSFLLSFVSSRTGRALMQGLARLTAFWLKYLDRALIDKPGSYDAASAFYFLGRKTQKSLPDQQLLLDYRGGIPP